MKLKVVVVVCSMVFGGSSCLASSEVEQLKNAKSASTLKPVTKADYARWADAKSAKPDESSKADAVKPGPNADGSSKPSKKASKDS